MAVTYEQLISVGMSEGQARLLASELRARDWTSHPMVVALVVVFLGFQGWLAFSVTDLRTEVTRDIAVLSEKIDIQQENQMRMEENQMRMEESQMRIEEKIDALVAAEKRPDG